MEKNITDRSDVEDKLNGIAMKLTDIAAWQEFKRKNYHGNTKGITAYTERWARLMQFEMASGKSLNEVVKVTSFKADTEDLATGFVYSTAVLALVRCWKYGAELRRELNL